MNRRDLFRLSALAVAWPLAVRAQQKLRRVGALMAFTDKDREAQARLAAFREGLQKLGWIEGRNI